MTMCVEWHSRIFVGFNEVVLIYMYVFFLGFNFSAALAHYHAAISIDINSIKSVENSKRDEFQLNNNNSIALSDLTTDTDVDPCALKKAHIKESIVCYEEALRLQRMSRDLKVNLIEIAQLREKKPFLVNICFFKPKINLLSHRTKCH